MVSANTFTHRILPALIFLPISAVGLKYLFGDLLKTGVFTTREDCPEIFEGKSQFQLHYLGGYAAPIEHIACVLVSFFHPLLQPEAAHVSPFLRDFAISLAPCAVIPFFEAYRDNSYFFPGFAVIMGILYQNITAGVTFPIFWAILHAMGSMRVEGSDIKRGPAQSVLIGIVLGYFIPCILVVNSPTPATIALWQPFPVYVAIIAGIYRYIRSFSRSYYDSGADVVFFTYLFLFGVSAYMHLQTWAAYGFDPSKMFNVFFPPIELPSAQKGHTALDGGFHLLQWDSLMLFSSTFLSSLWFADSVSKAIKLLVWNVVASVAFGPGAAVAGIFLWRERKLSDGRFADPRFASRKVDKDD